jgi:arylsulfatase A-like enzyme/Flp pilus assembly protein TadD
MKPRATVAVLVLLLAACRGEERIAPAERPPVILISIDTLRSDRLPVYGYTHGSTPNLDAFRRDAILHQHAYSHCPLTLPSHTSIFTGLLPTEHGVRNNLGYRFEPERHSTLARVLRGHGYRTGAAVSSYVLRAQTGIADGFESYDDEIPVVAGGATSEHQRSGFATEARAETWLNGRASEPFFFFLHLYEPHAPYTPPEPFRSSVTDAYDGEIATADAIVGRLIAALKTKGIYDRALVIITSDHGEALWEHGEDQHGILLYREVLQVPLLIKLPHSERAGSTVTEPFALRQIYDEVLAVTGLGTRRPARPLYAETLYPRIHLGWSDLRSLIDGRWHYIAGPSPELYDLEADPAETKNRLAGERRVAASMRQTLEALPAGDATLGAIDPEEAKKLAALGYIGTPTQRTGPLPNPRDEIHALGAIKSAFQLAAERRNDEAVAALRALLAKNPGLTDVASRLGEVLSDSGRYDEAIDVYKAAMARSERYSPDLALALAVTYLKAERPKDAAAHAELTLSAYPAESNEVLARAAIAEGRLADADRYARAAVEASNRAPKMLLLIAELQRAAGQLGPALATIDAAERRATELGTTQLGVDHLRADVLARLDRPEDAITAYRREITRFPQHLQSYANLAIIYLVQEQPREAHRVLEAMATANPHRGAYALAARTLEAFGDAAGAARWRRRM